MNVLPSEANWQRGRPGYPGWGGRHSHLATGRFIVWSLIAIGVLRNGLGSEGEIPKNIRPMQGFKYPLELHENGRVKTQITAGEVIPSSASGEIRARNIRLELYDEQGRRAGLLTADECVYQREAGRVTSDSSVALEKDGILITGRGFEWTIKDQRIILRADVKVVLARAPGARNLLVSPGRKEGNEGVKNAD